MKFQTTSLWPCHGVFSISAPIKTPFVFKSYIILARKAREHCLENLQNEVAVSLMLDYWNTPGWFHWHQIDTVGKEGSKNVGWIQRMSPGKVATIIDSGFGFFRKFYMELTFTFETDKHSVANLLEPPMFSKLCWHICGYQPLWIILWFFDSDNLYSFIFATQSADVNTNDALVDVLSDLNVPKCSENNFSKIIKFQKNSHEPVCFWYFVSPCKYQPFCFLFLQKDPNLVVKV